MKNKKNEMSVLNRRASSACLDMSLGTARGQRASCSEVGWPKKMSVDFWGKATRQTTKIFARFSALLLALLAGMRRGQGEFCFPRRKKEKEKRREREEKEKERRKRKRRKREREREKEKEKKKRKRRKRERGEREEKERSSDGERICSGSSDDTVRVWEVSSGKRMQTLKGHSWHVNAVSWSSDDSRICSGGRDKTVRVWEVSSGKCMHTFKGHSFGVKAVSWSSDDSRICSGSLTRQCECGRCRVASASKHLRDTPIV